jgi:hypothetical protein
MTSNEREALEKYINSNTHDLVTEIKSLSRDELLKRMCEYRVEHFKEVHNGNWVCTYMSVSYEKKGIIFDLIIYDDDKSEITIRMFDTYLGILSNDIENVELVGIIKGLFSND